MIFTLHYISCKSHVLLLHPLVCIVRKIVLWIFIMLLQCYLKKKNSHLHIINFVNDKPHLELKMSFVAKQLQLIYFYFKILKIYLILCILYSNTSKT